ncbi:MAG TPA: hypothetical protein VF185_03905 [Patescibacteria group bacterium]
MKLKKRFQQIGRRFTKKSPPRWLLSFIPLGIAITGLSGLTYLTVQQNFRMNANDPQVQIAEDVVAAVDSGADPKNIVPTTSKTDFGKILDPYVIVYDDNGDPIGASAQLDGKTPRLPSGTYDSVRKNGELRFTWEPKSGVRSAVVVKKFNGGFLLAGRSLREIEKRENNLFLQTGAAWAVTMLASLFAVWFIEKNFKQKKG